MISDPITLGVTSHVNAFDLQINGPGALTKRDAHDTEISGATHNFGYPTLTISHETNKAKTRRRSLFRVDLPLPTINNTLVAAVPGYSAPSAFLVVDQPLNGLGGDTRAAVKELLSRVLGFLSQNATGAPDHTFAAQTKVIEWLNGEP